MYTPIDKYGHVILPGQTIHYNNRVAAVIDATEQTIIIQYKDHNNSEIVPSHLCRFMIVVHKQSNIILHRYKWQYAVEYKVNGKWTQTVWRIEPITLLMQARIRMVIGSYRYNLALYVIGIIYSLLLNYVIMFDK
jgi:hypothetical protein